MLYLFKVRFDKQNIRCVHDFKSPLFLFFRYFPPSSPGYNTEMFEESVKDYTYPSGKVWKSLFKSGKYKDPSRIHKRLV